MLFNSIDFLIFFLIVGFGYFLLPLKLRWLWLLGASYFFYLSWQPAAALILLGVTLAAYLFGRLMGANASPRRKKLSLIAGVPLLAAPLLLFKYYNFLNDSLSALLGTAGHSSPFPALQLLLPVGISFFTFKALAYAIDVYRGTLQAERHAGKLALYISFFPQLLAGPIERPTRFLPQLNLATRFDVERVLSGLRLILWGLFVKVVIADRLAPLVSRVYDAPAEHSGAALLVATYLYAFQIFCDFAGYSDMAIGLARILGFDTMENFRRPYFAGSIADFWRRWHISLSSWFRDYLYIPLGGSKTAAWKWGRNVLLVFLVSGLWHGSALSFIVWGGLHGLYLVIGRLSAGLRQRCWATLSFVNPAGRLRKTVALLVTFHLVCFAWIFFRCPSLAEALSVVSGILRFGGDLSVYAAAELFTAGLLVGLLLAVHVLQSRGSLSLSFSRWPRPLRWAIYAALALAIVNLRPEVQAPFMYMQF